MTTDASSGVTNGHDADGLHELLDIDQRQRVVRMLEIRAPVAWWRTLRSEICAPKGISVVVLHAFPQLLHHLINTEASRRLARRKCFEGHQELADDRLRRHQQVNAINHPMVVV
jgi:hypothetical protein